MAGLTSEQLRAQIEAPGYVAPTVYGLNQPSTPGYVWDRVTPDGLPAPGAVAIPGYSVTFDLSRAAPGVTAPPMVDARGVSTDPRPGIPTQQEVEAYAASGGTQGKPPAGSIEEQVRPALGGPYPGGSGGAAAGPETTAAADAQKFNLVFLVLAALFVYAIMRRA